MANKTFINLSKSRQEEILLAAFEEFALKGYNSASLSNIIKKLKLAKGSFYRYFDSKKDLFAYLVQNATARRFANLDKLIEHDQDDFFKLIEDNFIEKAKFDLDYPTIGGFLFRVIKENDNIQLKDIIDALYEQVFQMIKNLIANDHFINQLQPYDQDLLAFNIFHMQVGLYTYISMKYNIDYEANIMNNQPIISLPMDELKKIIHEQVSILKNGIKANSK